MRRFILLITICLGTFPGWAQSDVPNKEDIPQKTRSLEFDFFSPVFGNTTVGYEKHIKNGYAVESRLGIIGLGQNIDNQVGGFAKVGLKFKLKQPGVAPIPAEQQLLRGPYFKIEGGYGLYRKDVDQLITQEDGTQVIATGRSTVHGGLLQLVLGQQWIVNEMLVIDGFAGLGYGFSTDDDGYQYGFYQFDVEFPIATTIGLNLGILLP